MGRLSGSTCAGLPDATAAAIVNSCEDWLQRKITIGLSSASLSKAVDHPGDAYY
jgi:hypothetical protein